MNRVTTASPWRWVAALASFSGLFVLLVLTSRQDVTLSSVVPASTMLVAGAVLYFRLSAPEPWTRIVAGPEARRFFAIAIACFLLTMLAGLVLLAGLLKALRS